MPKFKFTPTVEKMDDNAPDIHNFFEFYQSLTIDFVESFGERFYHTSLTLCVFVSETLFEIIENHWEVVDKDASMSPYRIWINHENGFEYCVTYKIKEVQNA